MSAGLLRGVERQVFHEQGAGADEAHFAFEDVVEFGKFIEAGFAQELAECREPLSIGQEVAIGIARIGHGTEFNEHERLAVETGALLAEKNRGSEPPAYQKHEQGKQRREKQQPEGGGSYIEGSFAKVAVEAHEAFLTT